MTFASDARNARRMAATGEAGARLILGDTARRLYKLD